MSLPSVMPVPTAERRSPTRAWPAGTAGVVFVGLFVVVVVLGGRLAPYRATALSGMSLQSPGGSHLLGTNLLGQDVLSQLILGARVSIQIALFAGLGTILVGGVVGVTAGWFGGFVDAVLMRVADLILVLPKLPLLLLVGTLTGGSVTALSIMIAVTFWPVSARILRAQVLTLRTRTHVRAATGFGAGPWYQLKRHILPDLALLTIAEFIPAAARAVALQAGLAFLGVGDPSQPSWGAMMRDAINYQGLFVTRAWQWWLAPPVTAVVVLVVGITLIGTAAERTLTPRLSRHRR